MNKTTLSCIAGMIALASMPALAAEHSIGKPIQKNDLIIAAVYLQPVHMTPMMPGMDDQYDAHIEADIHADKDEPHGFYPGDWIPYLTVSYHITKVDSDWETFGEFMPMVANDGAHYGANVKFDGPGKYRVSYKILPPPYAGFARHTDKETGVPAWWKPMTVSWEFAYVGVGKKGGY
ncbi:iron transporter [Salinisphaera aquimarina]|uniref:Iron transporter n=1 Tax=Salinisphaera aquimarina TaxID=2094031 RepID=A0ABV7ETT0_9GAMM